LWVIISLPWEPCVLGSPCHSTGHPDSFPHFVDKASFLLVKFCLSFDPFQAPTSGYPGNFFSLP
jgi:hypothetical protein